jgi:hypothetical protein
MLKTMEKLVDKHIRDKILGLLSVHRYQFAYQPGTSNETALHHVMTHVEEAVKNSKVTLGAFLDIEGAFDSTSFAYRALWTCKGTFGKTWGLKPRVVHWIYTMVIRPVFTLWLHGLVAEG